MRIWARTRDDSNVVTERFHIALGHIIGTRCLSFILAGAIGVTTVGCGGRSPLIGKWRNERGDTIEFFQDGTASFFYNEKIFASNVSGKWSDLDDDTIKVTANMGFLGEKTITADWTVSGETLVWKESGGTAREYHKVQAGGRRVRFQ